MRSFWSLVAKVIEIADLRFNSWEARAAAAGVRRTQSWEYDFVAFNGKGGLGIEKTSKIKG